MDIEASYQTVINEADLHQTVENSSQITLDYLNQCAANGEWHNAWLEYAIRELRYVQATILATDDDGSGRLKPAAAWLQESDNTERLSDLIDEAAYCESPVVMPLDQGEGRYGVAFPVLIDTKIKAVFSCEVALPSAAQIEAFMSRLEWLCFWLESHYLKQAEQKTRELLERQRTSLDGYLSISRAQQWQESALQWVDVLAKKFDCERVSLGFINKETVKLSVISGSTDHDLRSVSAKKVRLAMQEAFDQKSSVCWPPISDEISNHITHNTEKLSSTNHNSCIFSMPLEKNDEIYAVVLFERAQNYSRQDLDLIESAVALVGLSLEDKRQGQKSVFAHIAANTKQQLTKFLKPGYLKRKLFLIAVIFLCIVFSLVEGEYTVNSDVTLEPRQVRIVSAPFNGYIKTADIRAGDRIIKGTPLIAMEDRDLRLEKIKWLSQIEQDRKKYTESLASYERAQAQILFAKIAQSNAQLAVTNSQLQRSTIVAPFDALIVSGDLSKRVGGAVNQGEEMFQISPLNAYRLVLFVSEYKIRDVAIGQQGRVVLSSLPNKSYAFTVSNLTPVTEVRDGGTFFRVEARIDNADQAFRPGLVGVGKISVDKRLIIDVWTHDLRKWLALKLWSFWG